MKSNNKLQCCLSNVCIQSEPIVCELNRYVSHVRSQPKFHTFTFPDIDFQNSDAHQTKQKKSKFARAIPAHCDLLRCSVLRFLGCPIAPVAHNLCTQNIGLRCGGRAHTTPPPHMSTEKVGTTAFDDSTISACYLDMLAGAGRC